MAYSLNLTCHKASKGKEFRYFQIKDHMHDFLRKDRRYIAEILPIRGKTLYNQ